jgi:hypothetical protein
MEDTVTTLATKTVREHLILSPCAIVERARPTALRTPGNSSAGGTTLTDFLIALIDHLILGFLGASLPGPEIVLLMSHQIRSCYLEQSSLHRIRSPNRNLQPLPYD